MVDRSQPSKLNSVYQYVQLNKELYESIHSIDKEGYPVKAIIQFIH